MGETTGIQWSDSTWNPVTGCTKVSPGCLHCYAETLSKRFQHDGPHVPWTVRAQRAAGTSGVFLHHDRLTLPLRWKKPRRIFVNSMSDLFHEAVPDTFIDLVFAVMALAQRHTFQVLTKRPERMLKYLTKPIPLMPRKDFHKDAPPASRASTIGWAAQAWAETGTLVPKMGEYPLPKHYQEVVGTSSMDDWLTWPLPNVWLGTSVENQHWADERLDWLAQCPAAVRFVSYEPALGPVDLRPWLLPKVTGQQMDKLPADAAGFMAAFGWHLPRISWVICGGESGPGARPFDLAWARSVRDQCKAAGTAFFMKQVGSHPHDGIRCLAKSGMHGCGAGRWSMATTYRDSHGGDPSEWPEDLRVREMPT